MTRRKPARSTTQRHATGPHPLDDGARRFRSRGVDVEIRATKDRIDLRLDGEPIDVEVVDGQVHCQLANQFTAFESIDEVVDTLLANEGRTWTLRGGAGGHAGSSWHDHGGGGHDGGHPLKTARARRGGRR